MGEWEYIPANEDGETHPSVGISQVAGENFPKLPSLLIDLFTQAIAV